MADFLRAVLDRIAEARALPWRPVSGPALAGVAGAGFLMLFLVNRGAHWVPVLDHANLAFHEFGHPFFGLFSQRLAVYGGTLGQLVFPLITSTAFWMRRETVSFALCGIWLFENLFNIARYMADARRRELSLVGGRNPEDAHDWLEIFSRWGLLNQDTRIAGFVTLVAWAGTLGVIGWLAWRHQNGGADDET